MLMEINDKNLHIFNNLIQLYEAEFSVITQKLPDENGRFSLDTVPEGSIKGYLWYQGKLPAGFILVDTEGKPFNVNEFYVLPCFRGNGIGEMFFFDVLKIYPGEWQVKQLQNAIKAKQFWRKVIKKYTNDQFKEEVYNDSYWGPVTRQLFETK